jgi:hypothetical protein
MTVYRTPINVPPMLAAVAPGIVIVIVKESPALRGISLKALGLPVPERLCPQAALAICGFERPPKVKNVMANSAMRKSRRVICLLMKCGR